MRGTARLAPTVVAMSGGLDSSVTAMLLKQQGHHVIGVFMSNWDRADEAGSENEVCPNDQDFEDVQEVCDRLDIKELHRVSFQKEYWNDVFSPYVEDFATGLRTPNPDVDCNRYVKFDHLRRFINENIGEYRIATGHYARIALLPRRCTRSAVSAYGPEVLTPYPEEAWKDASIMRAYRAALLTARDADKDQSYFLSTIREEHLRQYVFPLGNLLKSEVRRIAASENSPLRGAGILAKRESMGVCFIGKRSLSAFLSNYIKPTPGRFVDIDTYEAVGSHSGLEFLTYGQGAKISGAPARYFICKKVSQPSADGRVAFGDAFVCKGSTHPALFSDTVLVRKEDMHFINRETLEDLCIQQTLGVEVEHYCKARSYRQPLQRCRVEFVRRNDCTTAPGGDTESDIAVSPQAVLDALRQLKPALGDKSRDISAGIGGSAATTALPFTHFRVCYLDGPECAPTPGQVLVLYRALRTDQLDALTSEAESSYQDIMNKNNISPGGDCGRAVGRSDCDAPNPTDAPSLADAITADSPIGSEIRPCLECIGGGKIISPGPSYFEQGRSLLPSNTVI